MRRQHNPEPVLDRTPTRLRFYLSESSIVLRKLRERSRISICALITGRRLSVSYWPAAGRHTPLLNPLTVFSASIRIKSGRTSWATRKAKLGDEFRRRLALRLRLMRMSKFMCAAVLIFLKKEVA